MSYITVKIDTDDAIELLMDRVGYWTDDPIALELYRNMYTNLVEGGAFDGGEFNVPVIVDNDWVNYCDVVEEGGDWYEKAKEAYEDGESEFDKYTIESVYEKSNGGYVFLIRYIG